MKEFNKMEKDKTTYKIDWKKYLSTQRLSDENVIDPEKDRRNPFEVDYGKVVFCPALRRMHDKTQVIPLSSGDCVLTRLTHSLHVMNIAESLAINYTRSEDFKSLYKDNDEEAYDIAQYIRAILKTTSLIHDIGNPPFGHFGEDTIMDYFNKLFSDKRCDFVNDLTEQEKIDFTEFDGNAQGLRTISKLQYVGTLDGLNLTYGTLGAYLKYPNEGPKETSKDSEEGNIGNHKHGIFKTEHDLFLKIVENCNLMKDDGTIKRHPLAFLMEAADTICYGTMDVEDGLFQNWYDIKYLLDELNKYISIKRKSKTNILNIIGYNVSDEEIRDKDQRKVRLELREHLITYLVDLVIRNFNENIEKIDKGEYNKELVYEDSFFVAEALKDFTKRKILSNKNVLKFEITGNSVISGLFDILIKYFFHDKKTYHSRLNGIISDSRMAVAMKENFPSNYAETMIINQDDIYNFDVKKLSTYARLRIIVDYVASMTDKFSVELYQTLSGNSI